MDIELIYPLREKLVKTLKINKLLICILLEKFKLREKLVKTLKVNKLLIC